MTDQNHNNTFTPAIHLMFSSLAPPKPDVSKLAERIAALDEEIHPSDVHISWQHQDTLTSLGEIRFRQHVVQMTGVNAPLPTAVIDRTVHAAHWQPQIKAAMRRHRAHLNLVYRGSHPDPVEKMIALYQAAHAFENEDLLGIANRQAWTAHPTADFLTAEKIASYRRDFPFMLWIGYVKFYTDKESYWLATKGHHIFDVPDLAYFIQTEQESAGVTDILANLFYFLYENDVVVAAGDTLEIGKKGKTLQFLEVPEGEDYLMGPSGALTVEPVSPEEINP